MNNHPVSFFKIQSLFLACLCLMCLALAATAAAAPGGKLFIKANIDAPNVRVLSSNAPFTQGMTLAAGTYVVQIGKEGFDTQTKKVTIVEGKDTVLQVAMKKTDAASPTPAADAPRSDPAAPTTTTGASPEQTPMGADRKGKERIYVKVTPADAPIRIINIAETFRQGMELGQGHYVIKVKKDGYETEVKEVDMVRGNDMTVNITLRPKGGAPTPAVETATTPTTPEITPATAPTTAPASTPTETLSITAVPTDPGAVISVGKPSGDGKTRITVRPEPADSMVRILNFKPKYQAGIEMKPGKYEIEVSKNGYETAKTKVEVRPREDNVFDVALVSLAPPQAAAPASDSAVSPPEPGPETREDSTPKRMPPDNGDSTTGRLYVRTDLPDARIRVLNSERQYGQGLRLPEGLYIIEVRKKGYETRIAKVVIYPGIDSTIEVRLAQAAPAKTNDPTPPAELEAEGSEPQPEQAKSLDPVPQPAAPQPAEPEPAAPAKAPEPAPQLKKTARLFVEVTPPDATVRVLGVDKSFEQGMEIDKGVYAVEVSRDGFKTSKHDLTIEAGRDVRLDIALKTLPAPLPKPVEKPVEKPLEKAEIPEKTPPAPPQPVAAKGRLFVKTDATDAIIKIMGIKPKFEQGIELDAGTYSLEVSKPGQAAMIQSAEILAGKETRLEIRLAPRPDAPQATDKAKDLLEQAQEAEKSKDFQKAVDLLNQALALDKNNARAYKELGDNLRALKQPAQAMDSYNKALELAPNYESAYIDRGNLHLELNAPESACYDFWKACALGRCREIGLAKQKELCR